MPQRRRSRAVTPSCSSILQSEDAGRGCSALKPNSLLNRIVPCHPCVGRSRPHLTATPHTARALKARPATDKLLASMPTAEFDSPMALRLEESFRVRVATSATSRTLSAGSRRFYEFLAFAKELFSQQGRVTSDSEALASNTACRLFLVYLADKGLGKTVVPAAKTMLNSHRALAHPGITPLDELKSVKMLLESIRKNIISRDMQAPGLVVAQVNLILLGWGMSSRWDEVMMAAVIGIGFQATLRPIEISCLGSRALWWVLLSGEEIRCDFSAPPPPIASIRGVILALLPRKNRKGHMSYLPSPAGKVVSTMWRHANNMHQLCPHSRFFFPARMQPRRGPRRTYHAKAKWVPNPENPFSQNSISTVAIPTALLYCCNIAREDSLIFSGYSLRVGGTTHHEESGTAESVRKNLAEWMSLATARHYLQHAPSTQFDLLKGAAI